jgi:hypothetical protein
VWLFSNTRQNIVELLPLTNLSTLLYDAVILAPTNFSGSNYLFLFALLIFGMLLAYLSSEFSYE